MAKLNSLKMEARQTSPSTGQQIPGMRVRQNRFRGGAL